MRKSLILIVIPILLTFTVAVALLSGCRDQPGPAGEITEPTESQQVDQENKDLNPPAPSEDDVEEGVVNDSAVDDSKEKNYQTPEKKGTEKKPKCTFSISCRSVFDNLDRIDSETVKLLPDDGWILGPKEIEFREDESVFDILLRMTKGAKIHMESNSNPVLKSKYVEGIHNLYEFDAGELSGWTYKINGKGMGYGSSSSYIQDGDIVEWVYTCDQGRDVGVTAE